MSFEVNTGTAASALDGTEKIPVSQGAVPHVITTARFPYLNAANYMFTDKAVNIDNGTGGHIILGDAITGAGLDISVTDGSEVTFSAATGVSFRLLSDAGSIANAGGSTTHFSWSSVAGVSGCTARFAPSGSTTGLRLYDADGSHTLNIAVGSNLTATRTFTLTTGNANRTLDISAGNVTITAAGAALIDDANAAAQRTTLELGSGNDVAFATVDVGQLYVSGVTTLTRVSGTLVVAGGGTYTAVEIEQPLSVIGFIKPASYTVGTVPSASTSGAGAQIYVTNESGGATGAESDGMNWRRYADRAIIS